MPGPTLRQIRELHDRLVVERSDEALFSDCRELLDYHHYGWARGAKYNELRSRIAVALAREAERAE